MDGKNNQKTILIIGLGNPGNDYCRTRHNLGFLVLDAFAEKHGFGGFSMIKDNTMAAEGKIGDKTVILAKPQTFMNRSGYSAKRLAKHYSLFKKKDYSGLWLINDDLDIPAGKIKISRNHGAAGHKGVQSIIDQIKTKDFVRFRIGIQPQSAAQKKIPGDKLVLKKITPAEQAEFDNAIALTVTAIETAINDGIEKAMTTHNQ